MTSVTIKCQRCDSVRIIAEIILGDAMFDSEDRTEDHDLLMEELPEVTLCLNCGQVQGVFPLAAQYSELKEADEEMDEDKDSEDDEDEEDFDE